MMYLSTREAEAIIKAALGGDMRMIVSVALQGNPQGHTLWRGLASILVFDCCSSTPAAGRLLASLKNKSHPTGAVIPFAGTKLSKLFADGEVRMESTNRSRWSADGTGEGTAPSERVESAVEHKLCKPGGVFLPRTGVQGHPIVMTAASSQHG